MPAYRIALLGGDGVGPEVVGAAQAVLEAVAQAVEGLRLEFSEYQVGHQAYQEFGNALPEAAMEGIRRADATLLGAMSTGLVPPPSPMGVLRRELDLYADVRPIRSFPGVWSLKENIDIVVVRENTEGFLADRNLYQGYGEFMPTGDVVVSLRVLTRANCARIARFAFEYARRHSRRKVTVAHKANVLRYGCGFFLDVVKEVARDYGEIVLEDEYVDSVANNLITRPETYDLLLTTNMFGDIISDEAAALVSSLVPTANIGEGCAVFRPVHEALLKQAGKGTANPIPTVLSGAMMLEHLGERRGAQLIEDAVRDLLAGGRGRTPDLGGAATTLEVTDALCQRIGRG